MTDIEIANSVKLQPIENIAKKLDIDKEFIENYGKYKAKITLPLSNEQKGKLILVTAINPTPYGEGKTTISIGLADGMTLTDRKVALALREPSLGPVFGIKGGATGGGYSQVVPMEDINLHFNGDFHAITSANNLLSALIDNHIKQGNELDIAKVIWRRTMDCNDRALRTIEVALGGEINGSPRMDGFDITAASEVMAILCLASSMTNLKERLGNIIIGYNSQGDEIKSSQLKAENAMAILLSNAIYPNLVQTLIGTPAFIHGGPFANIAHGCNSVIATKTALNVADYVVTEAGFGSELGAEKFFDIKCRTAGLNPSAVVLVVTARALKYNGGADKNEVNSPNIEALKKGVCNMEGHIENLKKFGLPIVIAINHFVNDTDDELDYISTIANKNGCKAIVCKAWEKGGNGCINLANEVVRICEGKAKFNCLYGENLSVLEKITELATNFYGAGKVILSDCAKSQLAIIEKSQYKNYPICIAKTQYSFSPDGTLGRPRGFDFNVRELVVRGGAEFIIVICGSVMLMPGLPKVPNAVNMTIDENHNIKGLF
jgi:formate--tetrahydrofolate ligase